MSLSAELLEVGIKLKSLNVAPHKTTCPRCSHLRHNKTDPCLFVNIKETDLALWKCYNCLWSGSAGNVTKYAKQDADRPREYSKPQAKEVTGALPQVATAWLEARGITRAVWERNKLFWEDGWLCFPYYLNDELVNIKYRTLDKKFKMVAGAKLIFYGLPDVRHSEEVIIVEGELDKLALEVCGFTNVISVPNGAQKQYRDNDSQLSYLAEAHEILRGAKKIIIATDSDQPGDALRLEIGRRVGIEKCWTVRWTGECKDANASLMEYGEEQTIMAIKEARAFPIEGLYEVEDFKDSLLAFFNGGMKGGVSTGFENVDEFYTVMPGETAVCTGVPGAGKSELLDAIFVNLAKSSNWNFAVFSPENGKEQHTVKLTEKILKRPSDPKAENRMTESELLEGAAWVGQYFHFIVGDKSAPTIEWILEKADIALLRYGINGLVIDPWNQVRHNRAKEKTGDEYIGEMLSLIMRWAKNRRVAVWIVAHPTKLPVDKDGKIQVPSLYHISGSANWVNMPDIGIVVHRTEDIADATEVHIRKVRFKWVGKKGMTTLKYDKATGTYTPAMDKKNDEKYEQADLYGKDGGDMREYDA